MPKFNFANVKENAFELLAPGQYDAVISEVDSYEKNGKDVYKIVLNIDDDAGVPHKVWDYITVPNALWKMKQFFSALGIEPDANGDIVEEPAEYVHETVRVQITISKGNGINPKTNEPYSDRNTVKAYLPAAIIGNTGEDIDIFA